MDLANAQRAPKPGQERRTHAPAENSLDTARCGAKLAAVAVNNGEPEATTCLACRAELVRAGILVDHRKGPRA